MKQENEFSFLFYDYETFGLHTQDDRIAQFACIRTNINLDIIEKPIILYNKLSKDYLPNLNTITIHNFDYQYILNNSKCENIFAKNIYNIFSRNNTCILGYNNISFDDEFSRNLFYRNFYDSYSWSWQNNNSRWDILRLVKACNILRPKGINWPKKDNKTIFNLGKIIEVNNIPIHDKLHDALTDVYSTIAITKLIKLKQPLLFNYFFKYRLKTELNKIINIYNIYPVIHINNIYTNTNNSVGCVVPLLFNPYNNNNLIIFDLTYNIKDFLNKIIEKKHVNKQFIIKYIKYINMNQIPIIVPLKVLNITDIKRLNFNILYYFNNFILLKKNLDKIINFIKSNFIEKKYVNINNAINIYNVDKLLYNNFFPKQDIKKFNYIQKQYFHKNHKLYPFQDPRANILFFKYRSRHFFHTLNSMEINQWQQYIFNKFDLNFIKDYIKQINNLLVNNHLTNTKKIFLKKILSYVHNLYIIKLNNLN
ncbi:exodeoxyribonuclease I [Enterobacteriaceae endosymbiont of Neohaemonia nigricornis]|uniref:exodeoxyribonuclease I n=1 Tax=Enterobacteriaceae endosymbiont of Neohaemonia nigricornis TaxID=2675792 RepID=UPI0014494664|nr:exodeoxyribonuclease I [Enterobacteriaceae endosymbiont of Neohaemonia nigricornis]QJC30540.1 exodeoxyribonuclease I [Enterobacteriaceae endosymbiont of Neohaemonia nigricornis]